MKTTLLRALAAAGALLVSGTAVRADETTWCNFFITSLPYTISVQGHYCFDRNLSTAITTGNAITVNSDFVTLDLNNFKLGGGSAGLATEAVGIHSFDRSNLTVRGGNIRGFAFGILVDGTTPASAQNVVIEHNVVDGNTKAGIVVAGKAAVIRHNLVSNTGGSTTVASVYCATGTFPSGISMGISTLNRACVFAGESHEIYENSVANTFPASGDNSSVAIMGPANTLGSLIRRNTVNGVRTNPFLDAVYAGNSGVCRDNDVLNASHNAFDCILFSGNSDDGSSVAP
jgi:hypothetical protein